MHRFDALAFNGDFDRDFTAADDILSFSSVHSGASPGERLGFIDLVSLKVPQ